MSVAGFFTEIPVYRLPHPPVPLRVILITHLALAKAFALLRSDPPSGFLLASATEDEITRQLHWVMENRLLGTKEVSGFDTRRFKNIIRAPEVTNYNAQHPAKKPDLVLFLLKRESLSVLRSHDGIFAECKPVDDAHAIGTHYCDSGIIRFVNGDYAWAMQEGIMVAFVRGGRSIEKELAAVLSSTNRYTSLGSPTAPTPVPGSQSSAYVEALHETVHMRSFTWSGDHGPACKIRIFHSWQNCS
jgi:hypothetical protein